MASLLERLRLTSYAGSSQPTEGKSRRPSYTGQQLLRSSSVSAEVSKLGVPAEEPVNPNNRVPVMLNNLDGLPRMDANRNVRRRPSTRATDDGFTCSQQSILSAMDRFVKSVNNMDATVLVPSRLRDMDFDCPVSEKRPSLSLTSSDLFSFYSMLKDAKTELLWGGATTGAAGVMGPPLPVSGRTTPRQHTRQPSDDSLGSTGSDQDTDSDLDSVVTDRDSMSVEEQTSHVAVAFRFHLQGLYSILHQLADSADYLSGRYQTEVDSASV